MNSFEEKKIKENNLVVIEDGQLKSYVLDNKLVWELGRPTRDVIPDIKLRANTVSRQHGRFQNIDGTWYYVDKLGKNGTVFNGKFLTAGIRGRFRPVILKEGDVLVFGGSKTGEIDKKSSWALFMEHSFETKWRVESTKGLTRMAIYDGENSVLLDNPAFGTVICRDNGTVIYLGEIAYLAGNVSIIVR